MLAKLEAGVDGENVREKRALEAIQTSRLREQNKRVSRMEWRLGGEEWPPVGGGYGIELVRALVGLGERV